MRKGALLYNDMVDDLLRRLMAEESGHNAPAWRMWVEIPVRVKWGGRRACIHSHRHRRAPSRIDRGLGALYGRRGEICGTPPVAFGGIRGHFGTRPRRGS